MDLKRGRSTGDRSAAAALASWARSLAKLIAPASAVRELRRWQVRLRLLQAARVSKRQRPHALPGRLIVSLTSYGPRFATLPLTLRSLLGQTIAADKIILWIAQQEMVSLPAEVAAFATRGITIRSCPDLRSYKKLIPALTEFPDAFIVTADDDLVYKSGWLEQLVSGYRLGDQVISARRAHRVRSNPDGSIASYASWGWEVFDDRSRAPSADIMPTTGAGALFPPGSLDPQVTDSKLFQRLCPTADDLWIYWMARRAGTLSKVVGRPSRLLGWPLPFEDSLAAENLDGGNDRQIEAMVKHFGNPLTMNGGSD